MFPKQQQVIGNYKIRSASRDPHGEGKRLAKACFRGTTLFAAIAIAAAIDLYAPGFGSPAFYGVAVLFSLIPMSVTLF